MVYTDEFLGTHCAVGKKGSKNEGIEPEELGALKVSCAYGIIGNAFMFKGVHQKSKSTGASVGM